MALFYLIRHINVLCSKLSKQIFLLKQLKRSFELEILSMVYFANVHSLLSYGTLIWGNSSQCEKAFKMQKRAVRTIEGVGPLSSCRPLFKKYRIMTLPCIYIYQTLLEIHSNLDKFKRHSDNHTYGTRSSNSLIPPRYRLTNAARNSLNISLYNKLGNTVKCLNYNQFKSKIKHFLLLNCFYSTTEYMEAPPLM